jgi:DivIVA domain-containing protein
MNESDRRQHVISTAPHLTPDEVATRVFGRKGRGYSENEVRSFLKRVSEELALARDRERELTAAMDQLEEQLRAPRPLSEQELLDALGEETARLLRSAREAGDDIRKKAEERAARLVDEASEEAERKRADADTLYVERVTEAETRAAEMLTNAGGDAADTRARAIAEADALIEAARAQGREMLEQAKGARERVLGDLVRRRALLRAQIEELRSGRERLVESYGTVKRTFLEATEALAQVEERAAAERMTTAGEPLDIAAEIAAEIAALEGDDVDGELEVVVDIVEVEMVEGGGADVDSLFARLRAGSDGEPIAVDEAPRAASEEPDEEPGRASAAVWRDRRSDALDPLLGSLLKRAKRRAQDDQNALLDAVRRHKGRPHAEQVLPELDGVLQAWSEVLHDTVNSAYAAGRTAAGGSVEDAPSDLVREAAEALVVPLRERVMVAIDAGEEGDTGGLVERIGARYREWKNQSLEPSLQEALAFSWSRGVYDAVPDNAVLWWVPSEEGRCSDCDDNGLEPTVKGKLFPTGQPFPPAHPGCRCLLAPAEVLTTSTAIK